MLILIATMAMGGESERIAEAIRLANESAMIDPPAKPRDYAAACAAVKRGETVTLAVGVTPQPGDYAAPTARYDDGREMAPGRYRVQPVAVQPIVPRLFNPPLVPVLGGS